MRLPELLAPAGSPAAGYAALQYGANAVYLGLSQFSARAEADNFTPEALRDFVGFAHAHDVPRKVFVTLNTLIQQRDLPALLDALLIIHAAEVDAVIIQDLGVLALTHHHFPDLPIHASTQMAIHNAKGAETARALGAARVTLAREMNLTEISEVAALPMLETEVFIHGSLCYSYSGLCQLSSMLTGRSANRGRCAYPCRGRFRIGKKTGHAFSMKDLARIDHLDALCKAGIDSLKIEGRKKSPLYVAATVRLYRRLLDEVLDRSAKAEAARDTQLVFSRPWTDFFLTQTNRGQPIEPQMVGHLGVPLGTAEQVRNQGQAEVLRLTLNAPIERHDGLQIPVEGQSAPFGFSVTEIRMQAPGGGWTSGFCAEAGQRIEVPLPQDHPAIPVGATIYHASSQRVKNSYPVTTPRPGAFAVRTPVTFDCYLTRHSLRIHAQVRAAPGVHVSAEVEAPGPWSAARDLEKVETAFHDGLSRLGNTPFRLGALQLHNLDGCFTPISCINDLRRQLIDILTTKSSAAQHAWTGHAIKSIAAFAPSAPEQTTDLLWSIKIDNANALDALSDTEAAALEEVVLDIGAVPDPDWQASLRHLQDRFGSTRLRLALPILYRDADRARLQPRMEQLLSDEWTRWEVSNLWGCTALAGVDKEKLDLRSDWPLYALNDAALHALEALGVTVMALSPEDDAENIRDLLKPWGAMAQWILFQDTPLCIGEACPSAALENACKGCGAGGSKTSAITDGRGKPYTLVQRDCRTILLDQSPLSLARYATDYMRHGLRRVRADFLYRTRSPEAVATIWRSLRQGIDAPSAHQGNVTGRLL